jgi:flagellar biosynthetic protein FliO
MSKVLLSLFSFLGIVSFPIEALSAAKLLSVNVKRSTSGVSVDLAFDKPELARNLHPIFERNFVQIVLKSTKIDSAQMIPVAESQVQKIFAYPYNADTARLRLILKREATSARGKVSVWNNSPRVVRVFFKDPEASRTGVSAIAKPAPAAAAPATKEQQLDEGTLLKEVVTNTRDIDINNPDSVKQALGANNNSKKNEPLEDRKEPAKSEIGSKADPSRHFLRMALALLAVLGLFVGVVFLLKRYASKLKKLPFGKKERLIQVVASHYLGNKKSISLVKVTGEYMVVGVSNEGISLISKLGPEVNVERYLEDRFWGGTFEKHLDTYAKDASVSKEIDLAGLGVHQAQLSKPLAANYDGARDMAAPSLAADPLNASETVAPAYSSLATIREKLTKLKPLA